MRATYNSHASPRTSAPDPALGVSGVKGSSQGTAGLHLPHLHAAVRQQHGAVRVDVHQRARLAPAPASPQDSDL